MASRLRELLVSSEEIAEGVLAETLRGLVSIGQETGDVLPKREFESLDATDRILTYLLASRAAAILKNRASAAVTPQEIASALHLDVQRTREALSRLKRSFVSRTGNGYEIPLSRVEAACHQLSARRR
jgi:hypothetical protein